MKLEIEAGKSYKIKLPNRCCGATKVHIDYILDNPKSNRWDDKLIVCRRWHRNRWVWYCYEYWVLAIYNEWEWSKIN